MFLFKYTVQLLVRVDNAKEDIDIVYLLILSVNLSVANLYSISKEYNYNNHLRHI